MLWKWNCRWDVDISTVCCSETVKIIFSAIHSTILEIGEKSVKRQGRNVKDDVIRIVRCSFIFLLILFSNQCHFDFPVHSNFNGVLLGE